MSAPERINRRTFDWSGGHCGYCSVGNLGSNKGGEVLKNAWTLIFCMVCTGCATAWVDSGHVGVRVTGSGSNKGIDPKPLGVGRVYYNPIYESIYEFPTFEQNVIWAQKGNEKFGDESITLSTAQGQTLNVDVALTYDIEDEKVPQMFALLRKDVDQITHQWLRGHVREVLNEQSRKADTMEMLGSGATKVLDDALTELNTITKDYGITVKMLTFANAPRPDPGIQTSINETLKAKQLAIQAENKIAQSKAEADQKIEDARGRAESVIIEAEAELKAAKLKASGNEVLSKSVTPELIQYQTALKWDGHLPQFTGGGAIPYINLDTKSKN